MSELTLVIGNRNYSSWSLRAWLAMKQAGARFSEIQIWFHEDGDRSRRLAYSPAGKVPTLQHGEIAVWDTLAIAEYLNECFPEANLWPRDVRARARARTLCAEMHSGFSHVRAQMPMNCRARKEAHDRGPDVTADVRRLVDIFEETRQDHGSSGPFLFGARSLADAFFAPIASRFITYAIDLPERAREYCRTLMESPAMQEWLEAAASEPHSVAEYDQMP